MQKVCEDIARANEGHAPGMSAVIGLAPEKVQELCAGLADVYAANLNSPKQTVVSGTFDGLAALEKAAAEAGARRALRLAVAGPYHSPLMQAAADEFKTVLAAVPFNDPGCALFSNVTGAQVMSGQAVKENAILHLTNPVRWTAEEAALGAYMVADGGAENWTLYETGVGAVLSGLWKDSEHGGTWKCTALTTVAAVQEVLV